MARKTSRSAPEADGRRGGRAGALTPRRIVALVLVALALVFIFENTDETEIRLLIPLVTMPLWVALLGMGVIGALIGALLLARRRR
ncbi:LapA family protein [Streptomyces viridochromogenes]|uniref:LapA family protein n=1 Tax=Streptomyces viridochromogenes TaxID=1938 RepID=UPI0031D1608E